MTNKEESSLESICQGVTPDEMMIYGLRLIKYTKKKIQKANPNFNIVRLKSHFGPSPRCACSIWEALNWHEDTGVCTENNFFDTSLELNHFLMGLHMLRKYPTEIDREPIFDVPIRKGWEELWKYIKKIQALKEEKIFWPELDDDTIWVISVDGTHVKKNKPRHLEFS